MDDKKITKTRKKSLVFLLYAFGIFWSAITFSFILSAILIPILPAKKLSLSVSIFITFLISFFYFYRANALNENREKPILKSLIYTVICLLVVFSITYIFKSFFSLYEYPWDIGG
ncbi:MAG: hypothetical protein WCX74_01965 [Candidatus Paceibacterota bacterium]